MHSLPKYGEERAHREGHLQATIDVGAGVRVVVAHIVGTERSEQIQHCLLDTDM